MIGRPSADEIVQRVLSQVNDPNPETRGNIILLHDSGGDRSATVAALPELIDTLNAQGYTFVPVSELAGMTQAQAMPPVPQSSLGYLVDRPVFVTLGWLGHFVRTLFFVAIWLGIVAALFLCGLALRNRVVEETSRRFRITFAAKSAVGARSRPLTRQRSSSRRSGGFSPATIPIWR